MNFLVILKSLEGKAGPQVFTVYATKLRIARVLAHNAAKVVSEKSKLHWVVTAVEALE